jgi:replicative DNA helicase
MLPSHNESEKGLLSALFRTPSLLDTLKDQLKPEYFFSSANRTILEALVGLRNSGKPTDWVTLSGELQKARTLDGAGGTAYLAELQEFLPTSAYASQHLEIIIDTHHKREILSSCSQLEEAVNGTNEELQDASIQAVKAINQWKEKVVSGPDDPTDQKAWFEVIEELENRYDNAQNGVLEGVPTGLKWLDQMTFGLQRETFYYIAALASVGKSAMLSQIAVASSRIPRRRDGKGHKSLIFSAEMGGKRFRERQLAQDRAISAGALKAGLYSQLELQKITNTIGHLREHIFIYAKRLTVSEIYAAIKRALVKHPDLDWIGIDYLQFITSEVTRKSANRENEVAQISRDLVALKTEFGLPIVCCAAINSNWEDRKSKRPILEDFRDSKMAAFDADTAIFLHAQPNGPEMTREVEFLILKNRDGGLDEHKYAFSKRFLLFQEPE